MDKTDKKYKVRSVLLPTIIKILNDKGIKHSVIHLDGEIFVNTKISGAGFHKIIEDALCIEQQNGRTIPVLPYRIIINDKLRSKALKKAACSCYTVLSKDLPKVKKKVWQI